ncbi:MAG TPA: ROK family protein, partial [Lacipirellulaceae bacterium]|nr:ROK family protein [Lacipirellulaceae bacterium]
MPESTLPARIAAVEAGGTKFVCAVMAGSRPELLAQTELPTGDDPADCLRRVGAWFDQQIRTLGPVDALGVATFGPADIDPQSNGYGTITSTPKPGWAQAPLLAPLQQALGGVPAGFDTDVNGAALGEHLFGAARGLEDFVYVTMGTGIGGGGMARGRLLHGLVHPEMGHLRIPRASGDDFPGACPYHGDCWEG